MMLRMMNIVMKFVDDFENMLQKMRKMMKMKKWMMLVREDEMAE
jgi:hypothetical protein